MSTRRDMSNVAPRQDDTPYLSRGSTLSTSSSSGSQPNQAFRHDFDCDQSHLHPKGSSSIRFQSPYSDASSSASSSYGDHGTNGYDDAYNQKYSRSENAYSNTAAYPSQSNPTSGDRRQRSNASSSKPKSKSQPKPVQIHHYRDDTAPDAYNNPCDKNDSYSYADTDDRYYPGSRPSFSTDTRGGRDRDGKKGKGVRR